MQFFSISLEIFLQEILNHFLTFPFEISTDENRLILDSIFAKKKVGDEDCRIIGTIPEFPAYSKMVGSYALPFSKRIWEIYLTMVSAASFKYDVPNLR